jgi:membrane protein DedA with SNARE-associated domain/rhodanese-related sulfurtransferase
MNRFPGVFSPDSVKMIMNDPMELMLRHGILALFVSVLLEEIGLPLPAIPFILAAGASVGAGRLSFVALLGAGVTASMIGDTLWYWLGRAKGNKILTLLCRISFEPDSCITTAKNAFERYRSRGLVPAKFVPGLGSVMPPLAGIFGVGVLEFLAFDGLGALLYVGLYGFLGYFFSDSLNRVTAMIAKLGFVSGLLVGGGLAAYATWKWTRRRLFARKLKTARITPEELRRLQASGRDVLVYDIRSALDLEAVPYRVPSARWIAKEDFKKRHQEIPRDREIVLYCSCPNEASAAEMALLLQKRGIERVRPLLGGIEGWIERGYATEPVVKP